MGRKRLVIFFSIILSLLLIGHFSVTFLYLSPKNPIKDKHHEKIGKYMSPYFSQNWYLFAPNPVNQHQNLEIRLRYKNEQGKIVQTQWKDISKPMVEKIQQNRLSPQKRIYDYQSSALHTYIYRNQKQVKKAENHLRLYVDYYLKTHSQPKGQIQSYQLRVVTNKFPRFHQRHLPDSKGKKYYKYSDWFPYS